jgi:hypothetical protein
MSKNLKKYSFLTGEKLKSFILNGNGRIRVKIDCKPVSINPKTKSIKSNII